MFSTKCGITPGFHVCAYVCAGLEGPVSFRKAIENSTVAGCQYISSFENNRNFRVFFPNTLENSVIDNELRVNVICKGPTDRTHGKTSRFDFFSFQVLSILNHIPFRKIRSKLATLLL